MIKVENIDVWGFEHAIRGLRNPMNSWDKSDSLYEFDLNGTHFVIGDNDLALMQRLYKACFYRYYQRSCWIKRRYKPFCCH